MLIGCGDDNLQHNIYVRALNLQVKFQLVGNKLKVVEVDLCHQFHNSDKQTFDHYPENLRLPPEKQEEVEKLIELGANKQKVKANLLKNGTTVTMKLLHNIQNKLNATKSRPNEGNELQMLLDELQKVPDAVIRVFIDENDELIGKFI